jgi:uncharacterized membrane protein
MSQPHPPGWNPGTPPPGAPPGYYPPQAPQGYPHAYGPGYAQHPAPPQKSNKGLIIGLVVGAVVLVGGAVAGALVWYESQEDAREQRIQAAGAERERRRQDADAAREAREQQRQQQEQQRQEQEAARVEQERRDVRAGKYLVTSNLEFFDKGIINDYRQVVGVTVMNRSKYAVTNMSGNVEWIDDSGAATGSVPFSFGGSLPAGDTRRFSQSDGSLRNGTLQTSAKRARIVFTRVDIVE